MRTQRLLLLLTGLLLAVCATGQEQKKDRGYWSLTSKKTFIEGEKSNGENTGIVSGKDGEAQFRILHYTPSTFKGDGTYSVRNEEGKTVVNMGGQHTPEVRNLHRLVVSWSKPPQYVKIGEEDKIFFDVKATIDGAEYSLEQLAKDRQEGYKVGNTQVAGLVESYRIEAGVSVSPEVTAGKSTIGFSLLNSIIEQSSTSDDMNTYMERAIERAGEDGPALEEGLNAMENTTWESSLTDKASGRLACDEKWEQNLQLGKESYMMVGVTTVFRTHKLAGITKYDQKSYTISQLYLYKNYAEGGDVDITIHADDEDEWVKNDNDSIGQEGGGKGENKGTELPPWVIPVAVGTIGGAVGYTIFKKRRKDDEEEGNPDNNPDGGPDDDPFDYHDGDQPYDEAEDVPPVYDPEGEEEAEEEEKEPSTFKMILYKEFGNTLMVGDVAKLVGARIEETTAKGAKIDRADLTAQIQIEAGRNIVIEQTGIAGKYRAALVKVEQFPKEEPMEGDLWFIFRAPGGALRNKLVFNIEDGRIEFFQPYLILPTDYKETGRLPFKIWGASDKAEVKVTVDTKEYTVDYVKGDEKKEKEKGLWFALIKEKHEAIPPKAERKAGDYTTTNLKVEVVDTNGHKIEGSLPIMRYNMGLVFQCDTFVGCFAEPYDSLKHPFKLRHNGQYVCPHLNEATYFLMTWDQEDHQLRRVVPVNKNATFTVLPLPPEDDAKDNATDYLSKGTRGKTDQEIIDGVGLQFYIKEILEDGSSICYIYAHGMLDAPARRKVRVHIEVVYEKEKYEAEQDVWLTSQPIRQFQNQQEELEASRLDDKMTDTLSHICKFIIDHDLLDRIGPVYKLAQIQLDGYDPRFGYDPEMIELLRSTFLRFVSGETLGANATPEDVQYLGVAAEILMALAKTNRQVESWMEAHGGVWTRIGIGLVTLGWSEHCVLYLRVADKMVEEINNPKKPTGVLAKFRVGIFEPGGFLATFGAGVFEVGQYAAAENIMLKTGELGGEFLATYRPDLANGLANFSAQTIGKVQNKLGIFGKDVRVLAKDMKNFMTDRFGAQMQSRLTNTKAINNKAIRSSEDVIRRFRQSSKWTEEEILEDAIFRAANKQALKDIKEMEHACIDYVRYRTPETKAAFREWCYKMQANKTAQKQLSLYKSDWANNMRSEYYRLLQEDYRLIDKEALADACKRLREQGIKVSEDDMYVFCATNSNSEALYWGDALTRDRDLSMMYKPKPTKANPNPLPEEVPQSIAEDCYGKAYKKKTGMTMKEGDQAVVQKGSKEMIGAGEKDLNAAFKKEHFNEKFIDLDGVATAYEHKPMEWIEEGARLRALGDEAGALAKEEEGLRQALKLYFNSLEKRATYRGTIGNFDPKKIEMFHVMKQLEVKTQGTYSISMSDFKKILHSEYSMDITDVPEVLKEMVYIMET